MEMLKEKEALEDQSASLQEGSPLAINGTTKKGGECSSKCTQFWSIQHMRKQMELAKQSSPSPGVHSFKLCKILCGSFACLLCLLVFVALPIAMIAIGSVYLHDCPGQRFIPIWLIVFGCFSVVQIFINSCKHVCSGLSDCNEDSCNCQDEDKEKQDEDRDKKKKKKKKCAKRGGGCCEGLISLFLFAWLIAGSVWVFGYYGDFQSQECLEGGEGCMCHTVPYLFSFVSLIVMWVLGTIALTGCAIGVCLYALVTGLSSLDEKCCHSEKEGEGTSWA